VLTVEDWAEIRRLHRGENMPIKAIARQMGISKNTVRRALASQEPPRYQRAGRGSIVDAVEPQIRELLATWPTMPATVIAERIGWDRSLTVLKDRVRMLRPLFTPPDPVSRTLYQPGELAQCDLWFPPVDIPLGYGQVGRPPVLAIVAGYSRMITARMIPSRQAGDLIDGHWRLLSGWGATPRMLVWDNESAVGRNQNGVIKLTAEFAGFAGLLGLKVRICRPRDPEAKGLVERVNGYFETSFLPGRVFNCPADFNAQLTQWLERANRRVHRRLEARPADRWEADRAGMMSIPPVDPPHWWRFHTRIGRDHYVRVDTNDYSVHPQVIGRTVMVRADTEQVCVTAGNTLVACHARCWAAHQTLTDPDHAAAAARMRAAHARRTPPPDQVDVEQRDLASYDRVFQVLDGGRDGGAGTSTGEGVA
jgi:transposase